MKLISKERFLYQVVSEGKMRNDKRVLRKVRELRTLRTVALLLTVSVGVVGCANTQGEWSFEIKKWYCEATSYDTYDCSLAWTINNVGNEPQSYSGYAFAVSSDGQIFQSTDGRSDTDFVNPGSGIYGGPGFEFTEPTCIKEIYYADSASGSRSLTYTVPSGQPLCVE